MTTKNDAEAENDYCVLLADLIIDQYIESRQNIDSPTTKMVDKQYNEDTKHE